jgi:HSP20 family protein
MRAAASSVQAQEISDMAFRYITPLRPSGIRPSGSGAGGGSIFDLHRQMNKLFDDLLDNGSGSGGSGTQGQNASAPVMDVHQENGRIEITAELPGVREEDIDLTVEEGVLILSGEKRSHREDSQGAYRERSYGRFERRITLPQNIDENAIEANFEHGVLTITLPLAERQTGRKIQLGRGKQSGQPGSIPNSEGHAGRSAGQSGGELGSEMGGLSDLQHTGGQAAFSQGGGSEAEGALIDMDSSRVGGPGGEGGEHHTPGMPEDSSAATRAGSQT